MTRIAYATATSLDGYLADANGSLDWLFAVEGGAQAMAETEAFLSGVAVQIEGSTTYRGSLSVRNSSTTPASGRPSMATARPSSSPLAQIFRSWLGRTLSS
jgi:hypothetical protein